MGRWDSIRIVGAYEHPGRELPDKSLAQIHTEVALGALADAGLTLDDVDGYFCGNDAPGNGWISMADYMGLRNLRYMDSTETGGSAPIYHVAHALAAIAAGDCRVALVTLAGKSRTGEQSGGGGLTVPEDGFEDRMAGWNGPVGNYALAAKRHMHEFGTTSAQLAEVKVAASIHASFNPNAFLKKRVTVDDVLNSPMLADPLHRDDCCVVTDGGGAIVVTTAEIARDLGLGRRAVRVLGHGEAGKIVNGGKVDLTYSSAIWSGARAFEQAGLTPQDIDYASIYDSFTFTVIQMLEDLGFCERGQGGRFVLEGALVAPFGRLPVNTDGGGLANNHPGGRGGVTKLIEAVRQLRGEANEGVQLHDAGLALVHGNGGFLGTRMRSATMILGREDA
ncbi:thiolase domain-containing protein [Microbacterium sp. USTB-Y]|uniref:thiolase domain-containing protein n=1 Tax=Microbacterium sp. USTB-Y TaxID=2823692 RepID=UPI0020425208|nr:thiolase domain-containing protein [Microbacterium sp. USTB-Y]